MIRIIIFCNFKKTSFSVELELGSCQGIYSYNFINIIFLNDHFILLRKN